MKRDSKVLIIFFIIASTFFNYCSGEDSNLLKPWVDQTKLLFQADKEAEKAKTFRVKSRNTTSYFYNNYGKVSDKGYLVETLTFDEDGNLLEKVNLDGRGLIDFKYVYEYDRNNNVIDAKTFDSRENIKYERISEYDKSRNETLRKELNIKSRKFDETVFNYDENGMLTEIIKTDSKDNIVFTEKLEYQEGNQIKKSTYGKDGVLVSEYYYDYNEGGQLISETLKSAGISPVNKKYTYDDQRNLIEIDKGYYRQVFDYNDKGDVIKETHYDGEDGLQQRTDMVYNHLGLMVERLRYDGLNKPAILTKYEYSFY